MNLARVRIVKDNRIIISFRIFL